LLAVAGEGDAAIRERWIRRLLETRRCWGGRVRGRDVERERGTTRRSCIDHEVGPICGGETLENVRDRRRFLDARVLGTAGGLRE